jgi:hypothetical protein
MYQSFARGAIALCISHTGTGKAPVERAVHGPPEDRLFTMFTAVNR